MKMEGPIHSLRRTSNAFSFSQYKGPAWLTQLATLLILVLSFNLSSGKQRQPDPQKVDQFASNRKSNAFVQIPHSNPPTVRPPPYTISKGNCPEMNTRENWVDTLCGDLNTGFVPQNPLGHKFLDGGTYPFDAIKNKTLDFFRRALPILKTNKSLPKVARYPSSDNEIQSQPSQNRQRQKRSLATRDRSYSSPLSDPYYPEDGGSLVHILDNRASIIPNRQSRQYGPGLNQMNHNRYCDTAMSYYNRLCKIYKAMWGKTPHNIQRDASLETRLYGKNQMPPPPLRKLPRPSIDVAVIEPTVKTPKSMMINHKHSMVSSSNAISTPMELPPTPCPSSAEYMTPVFARNHEGAWRYVVQIPKEGYFTQTVEVTKCLKSTCFYMEGSCKSSPRWQSLLVAELYYPDAVFSGNSTTTPTANRRSGKEGRKGTDPSECDGTDSLGCFQVRLFYDWFLIPGSCKCWKSQFDFTKTLR